MGEVRPQDGCPKALQTGISMPGYMGHSWPG